jgi:hypothetical protein
MTTRIITFADKKFAHTLPRFLGEANQFRCIDSCITYGEHDLPKQVRRIIKPWLYRRGYGYWMWKSYLIQRELERLAFGDILIWADAGVVLNPKAERRLQEYIAMAMQSPSGVVAFQESYPERIYTKGDVFKHFGVLGNPEYTDTPQFWGGVLIICKKPSSTQLIDAWWSTAKNVHDLITDRRSLTPNYPEFIENRHDQSVLSMLLKQYSVVALPAVTELARNNYDNVPFHPIRNKQKTFLQNLKGKLLLPMRYAIGLYLKYIKHFDFASRVAW